MTAIDETPGTPRQDSWTRGSYPRRTCGRIVGLLTEGEGRGDEEGGWVVGERGIFLQHPINPGPLDLYLGYPMAVVPSGTRFTVGQVPVHTQTPLREVEVLADRGVTTLRLSLFWVKSSTGSDLLSWTYV